MSLMLPAGVVQQQGGGGGGASTLFYDAFTDTDTTELSTHTPDIDTVGGGWLKKSATEIDINSNRATPQGADCDYIADVGATDVTVSTKFYNVSQVSQYAMVNARSNNAGGSGWRAFCGQGGAPALYENGTLRATGSTTILAATEYTLEVIYSGTSIKVYLDSNLEIDYTITTTESYGNYAGIQISTGAAGNYHDNFLVTTP